MDHWSSEPVILLGDFNIETESVKHRLHDDMTLIEAAELTTSKKTLDHIVLWPSESDCAFSLRPTDAKARVVPLDELTVVGIPTVEFTSDAFGYVSDHRPVLASLRLVPNKLAEAVAGCGSGGAGKSEGATSVIRRRRKKISKPE